MGVLVGKTAPDFKAKAVVNGQIDDEFSLVKYRGKNIVFFFYPLDFTFVCPTELHAFQEKLSEFEKWNAQVIGCSIDSHFSHFAWLGTPKNKGGIQGITFPIVSDINKEISKAYDVLNLTEGIAYRGLFLIDKLGIVRHQVVNDFHLGRSVDDALRILAAQDYFEKHGEVCPANWQQGKKGLKPTQSGVEQYFTHSQF